MEIYQVPSKKFDFIDLVDSVNSFLLGPNATLKESNRKKAQKQFNKELKSFSFDLKD